MSAQDDAAKLRAAGDVFDRHGLRGNGDHLRAKADELDPPAPPLPTEWGWHPNVRHRTRPDDYLPGAMLCNIGWMLLDERGALRWVSTDDVALVAPDEPREPRVLQHGDPCPEVGSRWRTSGPDGVDVIVASPGRGYFVDRDEALPFRESGWPWTSGMTPRHFPITEVLG